MTDSTSEAAAARLSRPSLAPLVDELVARFQEGQPAALNLRRLDHDARSAVADLLGAARIPATSSRVPIGRLVAALGLGGAGDLRAAVEAVRGPIDDRRAQRTAAAAQREALWSWFDGQVARLADPSVDLARWAASVRAQGVRGGVEAHRRRLEGALAVLGRLPSDGTTLAALAADVLGDPHGLDRGRSVAALVLEALDPRSEGGGPRDAEAVRALWEGAGVAPDALSSSVLVLGLRAPDDHPLGHHLSTAASASEPVVLTLAQLRRWPVPALDSTEVVVVVENPSLVAEAAQRGWTDRPPLVCSSGRPTVAVVTLLRRLAAEGATILQHADFDIAGLGITTWLAERTGSRPWRMGADDYRAAVAAPAETVPLAGPPPPTPWDPGLSAAMTEAGVAVYEEQLRDDLLDAIAR